MAFAPEYKKTKDKPNKKEDSSKLDDNLSTSHFTQNDLESIQLKADLSPQQKNLDVFQKKANNTGLPDKLKSGMESLSGMSLDQVNVHHNSDKPAQLNAHAFAQGTNIHLGSGQEKYLPHELGHVVQQAQGIVKPTEHFNGVDVNSDPGLEKKADIMGDQALKIGNKDSTQLKEKSSAGSNTSKLLIQKKKPGAGEIGSEKDGEGMTGVPGDGGVEIDGLDQIFSENAEKDETWKTGVYDESESKTKKKKSNDDGSVTTDTSESKSFIGAKRAITKLSESDDTSIKEATQYLAKMGAFGETAAKKELESSSGAKASAEGKASGGVGAEAEVFSATVLDIVDGLTVIMNASAKMGYEGSLEGALTLAKEVGGVALEAKLSSKLSVFEGVMVSAGGKFNKSWTGMSIEGKAEAFAGVQGSAEAKIELKAGDLGIEGGLSVEAMSGAKAGIEGGFGVGLEGIEAKGKLEAFAGMKAAQKGEVGLSIKGKTLFKISGELEQSLGIGGEIKGEFEFKNGKLKIGGKLAGTLGIGGGAGLTIEVDFKEIGKALIGCIKDAINWGWGNKEDTSKEIKDDERKEPPEDINEAGIRSSIESELGPHVESYSKKKESLVNQKGKMWGYKADNLVKTSKLQKMVDTLIRKSDDEDIAAAVKGQYKFIDEQIAETLKKNIDADMLTGDIKVNNCNIQDLSLLEVDKYRDKKK